MGDSRGRWEGNTLVVDMTNHNDQTWFDQVGSFHSTVLTCHRALDAGQANQIDYEVTIDDPEVFTQPWKMALNYGRNTDPTTSTGARRLGRQRAVELMVRPKPEAERGR